MNKDNFVKRIRDYGLITIACAVYALSFCWWFEPNDIVFGGLTGISQILHHFFRVLPIGTTTIVLNVPLFIMAAYFLGGRLLTSSLYAMLVSYIMVDLLDSFVHFPKSDPLLSAIFGGVILGFSMGLMLLYGATTGGTELAARLLKLKFRHLSIGRLCLLVDASVALTYAIAFRSLNNALYGIIALYISSIVMDNVIYGSNTAKMAYIISDSCSYIVSGLIELNLGVTILNGRGGFTGDEKKVILCAFKAAQIAAIKELVHETDPDAFIIVCEAHEVLGEGFNPNVPTSL